MLINVIENENTIKLIFYLDILFEFEKIINMYNNYQIKYNQLINYTKYILNNLIIDEIYDKIINILNSMNHRTILYENKKFKKILFDYKFIIRKYKIRKKYIKKILNYKIFKFFPLEINDRILNFLL